MTQDLGRIFRFLIEETGPAFIPFDIDLSQKRFLFK
jgi:hypothetical protein